MKLCGFERLAAQHGFVLMDLAVGLWGLKSFTWPVATILGDDVTYIWHSGFKHGSGGYIIKGGKADYLQVWE